MNILVIEGCIYQLKEIPHTTYRIFSNGGNPMPDIKFCYKDPYSDYYTYQAVKIHGKHYMLDHLDKNELLKFKNILKEKI